MWFVYFTDPVLRAPTIGCMLMALVAGLTGVIVFLRKESLLGESLSHASYPGVIIGILLPSLFLEGNHEALLSTGILLGAFMTASLGLYCIQFLRLRLNIAPDAALCFILSAFFGVGLTIASRIQFTHTLLYNQVQVYLYGQAATMTDVHIYIYAFLSTCVLSLIILAYKEIQTIILDRQYAKSLGMSVSLIDFCVFVLVVMTVVIGIRSVGVVLISAMLIAPPVAARQYTNRLSFMFFLSAFFGVVSGYLGNVISVELGLYLENRFPDQSIALPTGPMIVMVASVICIFALLFAPERGMLMRLWRMATYRHQRLGENLLKAMWYKEQGEWVSISYFQNFLSFPSFYIRFVLWRLKQQGWVLQQYGAYALSIDGRHRAAHIVRLHRLWEVYLVDYLGVGVERVHMDADEMEHIITPELERELVELLNDPKRDPHHQPIPNQNEVKGYEG
ncbi:MAG: iron chelate uptake ABC transporter family permease subunit [Chlamydiales bacterium]